MKDRELRREEYLRNPLPIRLTDLANDLRQISDWARNTDESDKLPSLMRQCEYMINWTAAELEPEDAAELVDILRMLGHWRSAWLYAQQNVSLRSLLYLQTNKWAAQVSGYAALLTPA